MNEEIILVGELDTTERGTKGFGSSDTEMNKQVGTGADLLTKSLHQNFSSNSLSEPTENRKKNGCQEAPRPAMMTEQVRTGANLLTKHSWKVTGRLDKLNSHNYSLNEKILSEPPNGQPNRSHRETPSQPMMTKQVRTGADLLTNQFQKVTRPADCRRGHNPPKNNKIHIGEITQKEFRQAYRDGETTELSNFHKKKNKSTFRK